MAVESHMLAQLRRYEDTEAGIYEEFAEPRLGSGGAFALLAGPLGQARSTGWFVGPTVGPGNGNLRRLEALVARELAASGFPTVRIRPDADPVHREIDPARRLEEVAAGVELLRAETGVAEVGALGVLFGGTLAALAAERLGLAAVALIQPATRGRQYARELLRREAVAQLMSAEQDTPAAEGPMQELTATGRAWIRGVGLSQEAFDAISAVKLVDDVATFGGRSLLVDISPSGEISTGVQKLADRLSELGGDVTVEPIDDPLYAPLGDYYYRDAGLLRIDTRLELDRTIATAIATWALQGSTAAATSRMA
jgi:pimeloyl-ACP methyl ester carboxylesterase